MTKQKRPQPGYTPPQNLYQENQHKRAALPLILQGPARPIRHIKRDQMRFEYDLWGTRLHPWDPADKSADKTALAAPFGGAWCVVEPGTYSLPHQHEERELFVCVEGSAKIVLDGESQTVRKGNLIAIPPETEHYIDNQQGHADFHFFTLWWDETSARDFLNLLEASPASSSPCLQEKTEA